MPIIPVGCANRNRQTRIPVTAPGRSPLALELRIPRSQAPGGESEGFGPRPARALRVVGGQRFHWQTSLLKTNSRSSRYQFASWPGLRDRCAGVSTNAKTCTLHTRQTVRDDHSPNLPDRAPHRWPRCAFRLGYAPREEKSINSVTNGDLRQSTPSMGESERRRSPLPVRSGRTPLW